MHEVKNNFVHLMHEVSLEARMEFYDTCALLNSYDSLQGKKFVISEISLRELEEIKSSRSKDEEAKFKARQVSKVLLENAKNIEIVRFTEGVSKLWKVNELADNNDGKIIASVLWYSIHINQDIVFVCDDVCCRLNAVKLGIENRGSCNHIEDYRGYLEVTMTEDNMASFFQNPSENIYELNVNEYLIIDNLEKDNVYKWNGEIYEKVDFQSWKSETWGCVKPRDAVQQCAFDSIMNNKITLLFGRAGSGKTLIPMAFAEIALKKGIYDKETFIYSYDVLKGSKDLGYEKGDHTTKLLNYGAIGNILSTKFGDMVEVERKIDDGVLQIFPTAYIRGMSICKSVVIITEAQNLDSYTLKTIIQRCEDDCKIIIEGDMIEQADTNVTMRGMRRFIEVFKGQDFVGIVKLRENYRSAYGELADRM